MRKTITIISALILLSISTIAQNTWTQKADLAGVARWQPVAFSIGTKGYIGTGYDNTQYLNDFWEWDQATNVWTQKADVPGGQRGCAVGFSIGNKGYVGTGYNGPGNYYNDFWEYDQATNTWIQKASLPGYSRGLAVGFSIGTKGYVGTGWHAGISQQMQDFYEWDQSTDTWTQKANVPAPARNSAVGFSICTNGYIGLGNIATSTYTNDFWEYNPSTDIWTQKANFGGSGRADAAGFSIGTKGYIGCGDDGAYHNDFWEWDQMTNIWTQKADFGGLQRMSATGFSIGTLGYIGTGLATNNSIFTDFWEYDSGINGSVISLSGNLDFGNVTVGNTSSPQTITITNTGNSTLNVSSITYPSGFNIDWSSGSIAPGNNQSVNVTFSPLTIGNYGGTISVLSDAINCINSINCTGVGITATPSLITINNELPNIAAFASLPVTLLNTNTNLTSTSVKICADGSTATKLYFTNNSNVSSANVGFFMASDPTTIYPNITGQFTNYSLVGNQITALFNHPQYIDASYGYYRMDTIVVADLTNINNEIYRVPVRIYRAPVIMVHGWASNSEAFTSMEDFLDNSGYYIPTLTLSYDYHQTNQATYSVNTPIIKNAIDGHLLTARTLGYSAGKVDYIGHSMGGDLGRLYLQGSIVSYEGNINRLITINTPHSGSQWANKIVDWLTPLPSVFHFIFDIDGPANTAIDDMRVDSYCTSTLLNGIYLNANNVPSHAIYTDLSVDQIGQCTGNLFLYYMSYQLMNNFYYNMPISQVWNTIFAGEANDIVVAESSQTGGLPLGNTSYFANQCHAGSQSNINIEQQTLALLKTDPSSSIFAQSGYNPYVLAPPPIVAPHSSFNNMKSIGTIQITSPINNSNYNNGDNVSVSINSTGSVSHISFACVGAGNIYYSLDSNTTSLNFSFNTPANYLGQLRLVAIGYDSTGYVAIDTVNIINNTTATIDSITYYPEIIEVPLNGYTPINIVGYFNDGVQRSLNFDTTVQYFLNNTAVATHGINNLINGITLDTTTLRITYQGHTKYVLVQVFLGDQVITSTHPITSKTDNIISNQVKVYPNPNNGNFILDYHLSSANGELQIMDITGRIVYKQTIIGKQGKQTIDVSSLNNGMYFYKIKTNNETLQGKFVIEK